MCACVHVCVRACMCACMHACMHVQICIYIYIHLKYTKTNSIHLCFLVGFQIEIVAELREVAFKAAQFAAGEPNVGLCAPTNKPLDGPPLGALQVNLDCFLGHIILSIAQSGEHP